MRGPSRWHDPGLNQSDELPGCDCRLAIGVAWWSREDRYRGQAFGCLAVMELTGCEEFSDHLPRCTSREQRIEDDPEQNRSARCPRFGSDRSHRLVQARANQEPQGLCQSGGTNARNTLVGMPYGSRTRSAGYGFNRSSQHPILGGVNSQTGRRKSERSTRNSPGRPPVWQRENPRRRHSSLSGKNPLAFERKAA